MLRGHPVQHRHRFLHLWGHFPQGAIRCLSELAFAVGICTKAALKIDLVNGLVQSRVLFAMRSLSLQGRVGRQAIGHGLSHASRPTPILQAT